MIITIAGLGALFALNYTGVISIFADNVSVEFRNYDDTLLYKTVIPAGSTATYAGEIPAKPDDEEYQYIFVSWDKSLSNVINDTVYHAQFQYQPRKYKVTFQNYNGRNLYVDEVGKGGTAVYVGAVPTRENDEYYSYRFNGWDKPLDNILEDTLVTAQFERIATDFDVTFKNYDGTVLYVDHVMYGEDAVYLGVTPYRAGTEEYAYEFIGWDYPLTNITAPTVLTAQYEKKYYEFTVTFLNYDETVLYIDHVAYGKDARYLAATPTREADGQYTYKFTGWNRPITNIKQDLTVIAQFELTEKEYTVLFYNYDDVFLYATTAKYGEAAYYEGEAPQKPDSRKYTYTFAGWDRDITNIQEDLTVYALYEEELRSFTCTFVNYDGTELYVTTVKYGETAKYLGPTPTRTGDYFSGYEFIGWDSELFDIQEDTTFVAVFKRVDGGGGEDKYFLVTFYDYDGTILDYDLVKKGHGADYAGPTPSARGWPYVFYDWSEDITNVQGPLNVFADYYYAWDTNNFPVIYRNNDLEIIYEEMVYLGGTSVYRGENYNYLQPDYGFKGWSKDLTNVRRPLTVVPTYGKGEQQ